MKREREIRPQRRGLLRATVLLLAGLLIIGGCNLLGGDEPIYETTDLAFSTTAGMLGIQAVGQSPEDVSRVTVAVTGQDKFGTPGGLDITVELTYSGSAWEAVIENLPIGPELDFIVTGFNADNTPIYEGELLDHVLGGPGETLSVPISPITDPGDSLLFPIIQSITRPAEIVHDSSVDVTIGVKGEDGEELSLEITSGGGTFAPATDTVTAAGGTASVLTSYTAPPSVGTYTHTVTLTNSQNNSVATQFTTTVVYESGDASFTTSFAPSLTAVQISHNGSELSYLAEVADDGPLGEISYQWSFTQSEGTPGAAFTSGGSGNPGVLTGYDETVAGSISLLLTDGDGLSTTATFALVAGQFPDDLVQEPAEMDYESTVVFSSKPGGVWGTYFLNVDTGEQTQFVGPDGTSTPSAPAFSRLWSPDRNWLIVSLSLLVDGSYERDLYKYEIAEDQFTRLTFSPDDTDWYPMLSHDGSMLVYSDYNDLHVVDMGTGASTPLTTDGNSNRDAALSADGSQVAFISRRTGSSEIFLVNSDGTDLRQVTDDGEIKIRPDWSPVANEFVYASKAYDSDYEIYRVDASTLTTVQLTDNDYNTYRAAFSPDGSKVAYMAFPPGGDSEIFVMNRDGSDKTNLTQSGTYEGYHTWSPDGTRIGYTGVVGGNWDIYVMDADGSNVRRLTDQIEIDRDANWW